MPYNKSWTKRQHSRTEALLKQFEDALKDLIEENNGVFEGSFAEILNKAGLDIDTYYGDLYNDLNEIKKRNNIVTKTLGRKGARYTFERKTDSRSEYEFEDEDLKKLLSNLNLDEISADDSKAILRVLKALAKRKQ